MSIEKLKDNNADVIVNKINEIIEAISNQPKPILLVRLPAFLLNKAQIKDFKEEFDKDYKLLFITTEEDRFSIDLISTREITDEDRKIIESKLEEINRSL